MVETVNAEQIKNFYNGKNNKPLQHNNYDYYEQEGLEDQINEFIAYSEVKHELQQYKEEYIGAFSPWKESSEKERRDIVHNCIEHLDFMQQELRSNASKILVYISLGNYGEYNRVDHIKTIKQNNQLLFDMNMILALKQSLNHACNQLESSTISSQPEHVTLFCEEIDMHLTILYMMIESNKEKEQLLEYGLVEFLFDLVIRLKEHFTKTFPLKKLMLTLYKVLLFTLGDLNQDYVDLKSNIRSLCELPFVQDKSTTVKCTPEDLYTFYHQSCERYPTFTPITPPTKVADPLTVAASHRLSKAMGLSKASKNVDLPYQTLFPSKTHQQPNGPKTVKQLSTETNVLPFTETSALEPFSLSEASSVWLKHLYISVANWQIIYEREKAVHRWERWSINQQREDQVDEWEKMVYSKLPRHQYEKIQRIEQLYRAIVPNFQSIVVVILKLLLSTVSIGKDKEAEILEDINVTRNRETSSKAVSGILLLLLKWFKTSHVLKFEHLSQVLIDSGCMLLILKLLGLQEVALLASKKTDDDRQSFFGSLHQTDPLDEEEEEDSYTNKRNLFWSINLLRVLQMLTKKKTHRILLLVQYKSSAILKRLLKVGHPTMDLYVLKNLKNQIPFMGRKWRSTNMKTISAIYFRCLTSLNDDWLSNPEGNGDMEEGAMKEISLRMLTRLYIGQRFLPNLLPNMDEVSGSESTHFFTSYKHGNSTIQNDSNRLPEYVLNEPVLLDDVELDVNFKNEYRNWLESDVYSADDDDDDDDDEEDDEGQYDQTENDSNMHIGTPLPDAIPIPLSAEQLTEEINKLYIEELRREFDEKRQKQKELELLEQQQAGDGWDQPIVTSATSWGNPPVNTDDVIKSNFFGDDDEADEVEPEVDPLQGINWDSLTEEELKKRLHMVEEKTVQRWLNVDMDDPRYLKVLNTFEGEVLVDDEGWPI